MCVREEEDECRARGKARSPKSKTTGGHSILLRLIFSKTLMTNFIQGIAKTQMDEKKISHFFRPYTVVK